MHAHNCVVVFSIHYTYLYIVMSNTIVSNAVNHYEVLANLDKFHVPRIGYPVCIKNMDSLVSSSIKQLVIGEAPFAISGSFDYKKYQDKPIELSA